MASETARAVTLGTRLSKMWDNILKGTIYASGALIFLLMILMSYQVIVRYFFNTSTGWVPDFATDFQYMVVMLGTAWVLKVKKHTKLDVLVLRAKPRTQKIIEFGLNILAFAACALFFYVGMRATVTAFARGDFLYREVNVPLGPLLAFIPFSFLLLSIQLIIDLVKGWRFLQAGKVKVESTPAQPQAYT